MQKQNVTQKMSKMALYGRVYGLFFSMGIVSLQIRRTLQWGRNFIRSYFKI